MTIEIEVSGARYWYCEPSDDRAQVAGIDNTHAKPKKRLRSRRTAYTFGKEWDEIRRNEAKEMFERNNPNCDPLSSED